MPVVPDPLRYRQAEPSPVDCIDEGGAGVQEQSSSIQYVQQYIGALLGEPLPHNERGEIRKTEGSLPPKQAGERIVQFHK